MKLISITVNGMLYQKAVADHTTLLSFLRDELGMTGTKEGCGEGTCGACSVLLDGKLINSCCYLAVEANGKTVVTVEGLARKDGTIHPLQKAFVDAGAVQCGFCTPGMLIASLALFLDNQDPSREDIKMALSGNLCRCTGYEKIIEAVELAKNDLSWIEDMKCLGGIK